MTFGFESILWSALLWRYRPRVVLNENFSLTRSILVQNPRRTTRSLRRPRTGWRSNDDGPIWIREGLPAAHAARQTNIGKEFFLLTENSWTTRSGRLFLNCFCAVSCTVSNLKPSSGWIELFDLKILKQFFSKNSLLFNLAAEQLNKWFWKENNWKCDFLFPDDYWPVFLWDRSEKLSLIQLKNSKL